MSEKEAHTSNKTEFELVRNEGVLELRSLHEKITPIRADFLNAAVTHRRATQGKNKELIARAVGIKKGETLSVLDTTAGLGKDAFILANLGCHVHCLERSPIIAALLEDGLKRFLQQERHPNFSLTLTQIDAIFYLTTLDQSTSYDVIYVDPMFPDKKKSALPKKEMQAFRQLLGNDEDAKQLFALALKHAKKRVVVKRPRLAETIDHRRPDRVLEGKSHRFDIYFSAQAVL